MLINEAHPIKFLFGGTPYSCADDFYTLNQFKKSIDYHKLNFGNPAKSSVTQNELAKMEKDYDAQLKIYNSSSCIDDVDRNKCLDLRTDISSLQTMIPYYYSQRNEKSAEEMKVRLENKLKEYKSLNCDSKVGDFRAEAVSSISDFYKEMDKKRIEAESKYQAKIKIFFGAIVLVGAVVVIKMFGKKK
jgi:hypothetical protein